MLKRKLHMIFLALILTIATIIGPGCKDSEEGKKSSSETDWGLVIFIIRAVYHANYLERIQSMDKNREPQKLVRIPAPSGRIKTDITDKGAGTGEGTGGGETGHC